MLRCLFGSNSAKGRKRVSNLRRTWRQLLGSERLESRRTMASGSSLLAGLDEAGNFRIVDSTGAVDDSVLIYRSDDMIVAYSTAGIEADGVAQTESESGNAVSVEADLITGRIIVDLMGGSNSLVVAWSAIVEDDSAPIPDEEGDPTVLGGISFVVTGDSQADDSLVVAPPVEGLVTVNYGTTIIPRYSGTVRVANAAGAIGFANLQNDEDAPLTLLGATEVAFNLPGLGDAAELGIAELADGDAMMLRSNRTAGGTFATTNVVTEEPIDVTINMGRDNGTFSIAAIRGNDESSDSITVNGGAGNDTINVGSVASPILIGVTLNGGDGNDNLGGGNGNDVINGDNGEDTLRGGGGNDIIRGGVGRDRIMGEAGNDTLNGDQGDDVLEGNSGDDSLVGGVGNDTLNGGDGIDDILGNEGSDLIQILGNQANAGENCDSMDGGAGTDTIEFLGEENVELRNFGGEDEFTVSIERINGRGRALVGTVLENVFDLSRVTAFNLLGIYGLGGNDTIIGTVGNDVIYGNSPTATGTGEDNDSLAGGNGNDRLYGGFGTDTLNGGVGNDMLNGGLGDDRIIGGPGGDVVETRANESEDDTLEGGAGSDTLANIGNTALVLAGFNGPANGFEIIRGNDQEIIGNSDDNTLDFRRPGADSLMLMRVPAIRGGNGDDTIYGSTAADRIFGEGGDDLLVGGLGNDYLRGGDGEDSLNGGGGVDSLFGDDGADTLTGGEADDVFVFRNSAGDNGVTDIVTDYRNDTLRYEGFSRGSYSTDYAAIQSVRTSTGLQLTQSASGKKVLLEGTLRVKPARARFVFTDGDGLGS
jgi:Ca2+-binding RTX toxin-like protein